MIPPPDHLDTEQREVWVRAAGVLEARGALTAGITDTLAAYCCAVVFQRRAVELVNKSNVVVTRGDRVVRSPALQASAEQTQLIATLADKLGLSPFDDRRVAARNQPPGGKTRVEEIRDARLHRRSATADPSHPSRRSQPRRSNRVHRTG